MKFNLIYITTKDKAEARKIGRQLLKERLVACVNIIEGMNSLYWWEDKICDGQEAILIAKTKQSLVKELIDRVKSLHSYSTPCVVSLPILEGNKDYLQWLYKQTK